MADITDIIDVPVFNQMPATSNDGSGDMTNQLHLYLDQQSQAITQVVAQHNEGLQFPSYTAATIATYANDTSVPVGTMWFDSTTPSLKVKTVQATGNPPSGGVIKEIDFV